MSKTLFSIVICKFALRLRTRLNQQVTLIFRDLSRKLYAFINHRSCAKTVGEKPNATLCAKQHLTSLVLCSVDRLRCIFY